jgi:ABC-type transport system involved in multi-copper enzyme maturation permease subunit
MNLPAALHTIKWLVRDTFRQSVHSGMFGLMLGISAVFIIFCLSVRVTGAARLHEQGEYADFAPPGAVDPQRAKISGVTILNPDARVTFGFGLMPANIGRDADDSLRLIQLLLAGLVADTLGVLVALVFTAGFIPSFLDPASATVLLAKPVPRWTLLTGKFVGVLCFVAFQASVFVGGTWLAFGVGTGYWNGDYLLCIPLLLLHFGVFFSVSLFVAVCTRSTVACVLSSLVFWFLCFGLNYARHYVVCADILAPESPTLPASLSWLAELGYWVFPKPADLNLILHDSLHSGTHFGELEALREVKKTSHYSPELSIVSSVLAAGLLVFLAVRQLAKTDY